MGDEYVRNRIVTHNLVSSGTEHIVGRCATIAVAAICHFPFVVRQTTANGKIIAADTVGREAILACAALH